MTGVQRCTATEYSAQQSCIAVPVDMSEGARFIIIALLLLSSMITQQVPGLVVCLSHLASGTMAYGSPHKQAPPGDHCAYMAHTHVTSHAPSHTQDTSHRRHHPSSSQGPEAARLSAMRTHALVIHIAPCTQHLAPRKGKTGPSFLSLGEWCLRRISKPLLHGAWWIRAETRAVILHL